MGINKTIARCPWADGDDRMAKYHDEVWGVPEHDDQKLFAKLCLDLMQAGLMWKTILHKQENFMRAFDDFHIETVSKYDDAKYNELMQDAGIVRNRLKITAIINNASRVMEIQQEFGSFDAYLCVLACQGVFRDFKKYFSIPRKSLTFAENYVIIYCIWYYRNTVPTNLVLKGIGRCSTYTTEDTRAVNLNSLTG